MLAIVAALVLGLLAVAFTVAAADSADIPTCDQVRSGEEPPEPDGDCADTGETANAIASVTLLIAGGSAILSAMALLGFGVSGRRPWLRRFVILLGAAVAVFALTALITRI